MAIAMWSAYSAALTGIIPFAISEFAISSALSVINIKGTFFRKFKQRENKNYYFKDKSECNFILKKGLEVTEAIHVLANLSNATTKQREIRGLTECCNKFGLRRGLMIRHNVAEKFEHHEIAVTVMPLYRWLLLQ